MKIQVLGPGCPNCLALEANAKKAVEELKIKAEIEHVFDINKMVEMGMMMSPGLAIDGELVSQGKIPSVEEIKDILKSKFEK
ncbi:MAG: small redox-active disulfide protein 2 [Microgenomates group bacterium LiPW_16]|nr:MAG: small redox-active disulfide protein 2 [Microgenomates group bacterium LiPW_16]